MNPINLTELIENLPFGGGLAFDARHRNIPAMTQLLSEGTCPTSALNVLHYYPEHVFDVLEATTRLSPELRERNQAILGAICRRMKGRQLAIYAHWQDIESVRRCGEAARAACREIALEVIHG